MDSKLFYIQSHKIAKFSMERRIQVVQRQSNHHTYTNCHVIFDLFSRQRDPEPV